MRRVFEKVEGTIDGKVLRDSDERGIEGVWVWGVEGIVYGNGLKLSDVLLDGVPVGEAEGVKDDKVLLDFSVEWMEGVVREGEVG